MRPLLVFTLLVMLFIPGAAESAPPRPRPYSGIGILLVANDAPGAGGALALYQEPGLLRLVEVEAARLPRLSRTDANPLLAVGARRGRWTRIAYDDAGREGWIETPRSWQYLPWEEFLPGRTLRILPGMKKEFYQLSDEPRQDSAPAGTVVRDQEVRVLRLEGEWVLLETPPGWFRWRDPDGRLTIALP